MIILDENKASSKLVAIAAIAFIVSLLVNLILDLQWLNGALIPKLWNIGLIINASDPILQAL